MRWTREPLPLTAECECGQIQDGGSGHVIELPFAVYTLLLILWAPPDTSDH